MDRSAALEISVDIEAPCEHVFDLIHDYEARLRWDTLLSKACILDKNVTHAAAGVRTLCVGRATLGKIAVETIYVSFNRPTVAAVRMLHGPWFLAEFAASIRHTPTATGSRTTYKLRIKSRPAILRPLLDPILRAAFHWETRKRLHSLKRYLESRA